MNKVSIHAAKTNLSKLIERVQNGEEVVIARGDEPVARLVPIASSPYPKGRRFGALAHVLPPLDDAILDDLPPDELDAWEQ